MTPIETWAGVGARIADARKTARMSQAELARALEVDRTVITKIEKGIRAVSALELASLAQLLGRRIEWFLQPSPPSVVSRRSEQARLATKVSEADAGTKVSEAAAWTKVSEAGAWTTVSEAGAWTTVSEADALLEGLARDADLLVRLGVLSPPEAPAVAPVASGATAEEAAQALRAALGIAQRPIWNLQKVAEAAGLYAFSLSLAGEALDGSYLRLKRGGVALVNGAAPSGRRRFTLVHELGHHVLADDYSTEWIVGEAGQDRERLINAFCIHFLMPRKGVAKRWKALGGAADPRRAAVAVAAEFGVSWSAAVPQLRRLELISESTRAALESDPPRKGDYLEAGIALTEDLGPPSLPPAFAAAVVKAYKGHKISGPRALEMLRGTLAEAELPVRHDVPPEAMISQLDWE